MSKFTLVFGLNRTYFLSSYRIASFWSNQNNFKKFFSLYKIKKKRKYVVRNNV